MAQQRWVIALVCVVVIAQAVGSLCKAPNFIVFLLDDTGFGDVRCGVKQEYTGALGIYNFVCVPHFRSLPTSSHAILTLKLLMGTCTPTVHHHKRQTLTSTLVSSFVVSTHCVRSSARPPMFPQTCQRGYSLQQLLHCPPSVLPKCEYTAVPANTHEILTALTNSFDTCSSVLLH